MALIHTTALDDDTHLNGFMSIPVSMLSNQSTAVMFVTPNRLMVVPVSLYIDEAEPEYTDGEHYLCLNMKKVQQLNTHPCEEYGEYYPCVTPSRSA